MKNYEKELLYAYPALEEIIDAYDTVFLKRALSSYSSGRPAIEEAEALIGKIAEKDLYILIKLRLDRVLESFSSFGAGSIFPINTSAICPRPRSGTSTSPRARISAASKSCCKNSCGRSIVRG